MIGQGDLLDFALQVSNELELAVAASAASKRTAFDELSFIIENTAVAVRAPGLDRFEILWNGVIELTDRWFVEIIVEALSQLAGVIDAEADDALPPQRISKVHAARWPFDLPVFSNFELHLLVRVTAQAEVTEWLQLC